MEINFNVSGTLATIKPKFKFPIYSKRRNLRNIPSNWIQLQDYSCVTQTYFVKA